MTKIIHKTKYMQNFGKIMVLEKNWLRWSILLVDLIDMKFLQITQNINKIMLKMEQKFWILTTFLKIILIHPLALSATHVVKKCKQKQYWQPW